MAVRNDGQIAKMVVANTVTPDAYLTDGARRKEDGKSVLTSIADRRIRKLTSKECFRLMGFFDDKINLDGISNSQQYKLAGNGWDINLVRKIFENMFNVMGDSK
jgi:site-specific DNA-cytosine methylase